MISKLAYVHPEARLGADVTVEPFACIAADVVIGDGCWIGPGAVIHDGARLGRCCKVHTAASVSCLPQDLKFAGEKTVCEIGDGNTNVRFHQKDTLRRFFYRGRQCRNFGKTRVTVQNHRRIRIKSTINCFARRRYRPSLPQLKQNLWPREKKNNG